MCFQKVHVLAVYIKGICFWFTPGKNNFSPGKLLKNSWNLVFQKGYEPWVVMESLSFIVHSFIHLKKTSPVTWCNHLFLVTVFVYSFVHRVVCCCNWLQFQYCMYTKEQSLHIITKNSALFKHRHGNYGDMYTMLPCIGCLLLSQFSSWQVQHANY